MERPSFFALCAFYLKMPKISPKMSPRGPQEAPRGPQEGPHMGQFTALALAGRGFYKGLMLEALLGPILDPFWGRLGPILGPSWALLGPSGGPLGPSWSHRGPSGGHLRIHLGKSPKGNFAKLRKGHSQSATKMDKRGRGGFGPEENDANPTSHNNLSQNGKMTNEVMCSQSSNLFLPSWAT